MLDEPLVLITGPMFAGKSTELGRRYETRRILGTSKVVIIAPSTSKDALSGSIRPRNSKHYDAMFVARLTIGLAVDLIDAQHDYVYIDEAQFFDCGDELTTFCKTLLDRGVCVCVAALDMDFRRRSWPAIVSLQTLSPVIELLHARCTAPCKQPAIYSAKITPSAAASESAVVDVHAEYMPLCRACYLKNHSRKKQQQDTREEHGHVEAQ